MDEAARALERAAAAGDPEALARLEHLRLRRGEDVVIRPHTGRWLEHDDDCWCVAGSTPEAPNYCNRGGFAWTCCGAYKEDSDCSRPRMHPTYDSHPRRREAQTWEGSRSVYRTNAEIRELDPDAFR